MFNYRESSLVLCQEKKDIFSLHSIIQILWNLRHFRDDFLKRQPVCSPSWHDAPCIAQILYKIFSTWEKNYYQKISYPLISLRNAICQVLSCRNSFQNVAENTSPYIVATILRLCLFGLQLPSGRFYSCSSQNQLWLLAAAGWSELSDVCLFPRLVCCNCNWNVLKWPKWPHSFVDQVKVLTTVLNINLVLFLL